MKIVDRLKAKAKALKREVTALCYAYRHPGLPAWPKIVIAVTVAYALSPIDLIPDFIPVLGCLDDLLILPALIALAVKLIPKTIMEASRKKADAEPLRLKHNWVFAVIFIAIWIVILGAIAWSLVKLFIK